MKRLEEHTKHSLFVSISPQSSEGRQKQALCEERKEPQSQKDGQKDEIWELAFSFLSTKQVPRMKKRLAFLPTSFAFILSTDIYGVSTMCTRQLSYPSLPPFTYLGLFILRKRERACEQGEGQRKGERENPKQIPCYQHRARCRAQIHDLRDHDLSQNPRVRCLTN